ncbi:hypothetical protein PRVXT_001883 [Proteinivorax tanatarense]|uniref:Uncharacterized protein n=1 Tax=Proteinivorax tanatarense TaxID=1260629 RepID=A0AAU7VJ63_9FIRM
MARNNSRGLYIGVVLLFLCITGLFIFTEEPKTMPKEEPQFYEVYQDKHVRVSLGYENPLKASENGKILNGEINSSTSNIILIFENLKTEGLIIVPTPMIQVLNYENEPVQILKPKVNVEGIADPLETTYIFIENPIPSSNVKPSRYNLNMEIPYNYIFYDRVDHEDVVQIQLTYDIREESSIISSFSKLLLLITLTLTVILFLSKRRKKTWK